MSESEVHREKELDLIYLTGRFQESTEIIIPLIKDSSISMKHIHAIQRRLLHKHNASKYFKTARVKFFKLLTCFECFSGPRLRSSMTIRLQSITRSARDLRNQWKLRMFNLVFIFNYYLNTMEYNQSNTAQFSSDFLVTLSSTTFFNWSSVTVTAHDGMDAVGSEKLDIISLIVSTLVGSNGGHASSSLTVAVSSGRVWSGLIKFR